MAKPTPGTAVNASHALGAKCVAYWPFSEGSGMSAYEGVAGRNATFGAGFSWGTEAGDPCGVFAGTTTQAFAGTGINLAGSAWTVIARYRISVDWYENYFWQLGDVTSTRQIMHLADTYSQQSEFRLYGDDWQAPWSNKQLNVIHEIAFVMDAAGAAVLYRDKVSQGTHAFGGAINPSTKFWLGSAPVGPGGHEFQGSLIHLAVFNQALTATEVGTFYDNPYAMFGATVPKAATLTDDFDDNSLNTTKWATYADPSTSLAETNQRLELTLRANGTGYVGVYSNAKYDLTGSYLMVECPDRGAGGSGQTSSLELDLDSSNTLKVLTDGTGIMAQTIIAGANTSFGIVTYSATTHRWWRIREAGGTVFFETSPTGAPGSWTALYSRTNPFALTAITPKLFGGTYSSMATPGVPKFDNFNVVGPGQASLPASDASAGTWTTDTGATTNLYAAIDEPDFNDADYIQSVAGPASAVYEANLGAIGDPLGNTGHVVQVRALLDAASGPPTLTTELRQGASALSTPASWTDTPTTTAQTFAHTLSAAQADAITDYNQLRLRVTADQTAAAGTAPTFVGAGTYVQTSTNAATLTPGLPSGWAAGDIHLLIASRKDTTAMTALAGWTQHTLLFGNNSTGLRTEVWWRRAVAGDTAPTITFGSSTVLRQAQILGVRGCPPTGSPFSQTSAPADAVSRRVNPSSTSVLTTSVTPTENSLAVVAFTQASGPTTATQISGAFTVFTVNRSGNNGIGMGYCSGTTTWNANTALAPTTTTSQAGLNDGLLLAMRPTPGVAASSRFRVTWAALLAPAVPPVPVTKRWDGSAWQTAVVKRWDGSAWQTATVQRY